MDKLGECDPSLAVTSNEGALGLVKSTTLALRYK